tara:strand:- start:297 stop:1160 length:864 start_codon:yes stop_codon:yes gene_type:complete
MELTTIDTNNYAMMAKAMGLSAEVTDKKSSNLPRLRINHSPIIGADKVLVKAGTYRLEVPDGPTYYGESAIIRPYMQRFMYKRFIKGMGDTPNRYVKTVMADNLNMDLKDNDGGFNCGKPAGYIEDFKALPQTMQDLIRQIKRVRAVFGTIELLDAVTPKGDSVKVDVQPFIWEIDNRDAFKEIGLVFTKLAKMQRLPVQHDIVLNTLQRELPNGNSFYLPTVSLNLNNTLDIEESEHSTFSDFLSWIENYNTYILNAWTEKANEKMEEDDIDVVDDLVDIEVEEVA